VSPKCDYTGAATGARAADASRRTGEKARSKSDS